MAEISVPAWPIPIHQTKLMIAKPHATGIVDAPDADALEEQPGDRDQQHVQQHERDHAEADEPAQRRVRRQHDAARSCP